MTRRIKCGKHAPYFSGAIKQPSLVSVQSHNWRTKLRTVDKHLLCHLHDQINLPHKNCHIKIVRFDHLYLRGRNLVR